MSQQQHSSIIINESSPLIIKNHETFEKDDEMTSSWKIWETSAPTHRFFLLIFICFIPFGGHFVKNCMSSIEQLMLEDPEFPLNNTMYGALIASVSIPSMIIPFLGGAFLDKRGHRGLIFFLACTVLGQIIFSIAMQSHSFWFAIFGRIIFGIGEGSVVVGSRVIVSHWFENKELTFAMGMTVAIANVSKMLAKATVAPVAIALGSYVYALWYSVLICIFSLFMGMYVLRCTKKLRRLVRKQMKYGQPVREGMEWIAAIIRRKQGQKHTRHVDCRQLSWSTVKFFSTTFWLLALIHVVFINVFHLFQNVSSSFLYQEYGYSVIKSGLVSSLSHILVIFAPLIGILLDKLGGRMYLVTIAGIISILAYSLLIFSNANPIVSMILISLCLSFTPTILMASIPLAVPSTKYGLAFGIVEVTDAIGATSGNLFIGYIRDITGSYGADMYFLLGMAIFSLLVTLYLIWYDDQNDQVLNQALRRSGRFASIDDDDPCGDVGHDLMYGDSSTDENSPQSIIT